jgi:hypothetical protein
MEEIQMAFGDFHLSKNDPRKAKPKKMTGKAPVADRPVREPSTVAVDVVSKTKS